MTNFKRNQILVLLGAGASVDAGIPDAQTMVGEIANLVSGDDATIWTTFKDLFNYLRSACHYAHGLRGVIGDKVPFNVETLVNTLDELEKKEAHPLYPFVGAWNPKLMEVAGPAFERARQFRQLIVERLRDEWLAVTSYEDDAGYFGGLLRFQHEYEFPLRVFSLNYDLCVEKVCGFENVQRGFDGRRWDWRLFDETDEEEQRSLLLYKLHGSTDWTYAEEGHLTFHDESSRIQADRVALIFGATYKLQYLDPFLFFAYELRRWTLDRDANLIVVIGYGLGDPHINGILTQALRQDRSRRVLFVAPTGEAEKRRDEVRNALSAELRQIIVDPRTAKDFLNNGLSIQELGRQFPEDPGLVTEL
jgi:SIR2-like domain